MHGVATDDIDSLPDETDLWRRVPIQPSWCVWDQNEGRVRPSSGAFKDNKKGSVSAYIAAEVGSVESLLEGYSDFRVVRFSLGLVRACKLVAERDASGGPGHVLLHGDKNRHVEIDGALLRVMEALARKCQWIGPAPSPPS